MTRRIAAIIFIFACTSIAWGILGATILARTENYTDRLRDRVGTIWGTPQVQSPPRATYSRTITETVERTVEGKSTTAEASRTIEHPIVLDSSDITVDLDLEHRKKGLLWYSTYKVDFRGEYTFNNSSTQKEIVTIRFKFPSENAIYDNFRVLVSGEEFTPKIGSDLAKVQVPLEAGESVDYSVSYRSQGLEKWTYRFSGDVEQVSNFTLRMHTNFNDIDFPDSTLSPTEKVPAPDGWRLTWRYQSLLSGFDIGMGMPQKLQPGPLTGQISFFAPVSLFFFFFLIFIITTLRDIELHPMNYFFLAAAFFSFHLLLAYLADHLSIHLAFGICSAVSICLVVSYLRLVVGMRFAAVEAGITQFIYLVVFSYAFFFKGFTGLSITIGSIATLFVVMQMTGRIRWAEKFARGSGLMWGK